MDINPPAVLLKPLSVPKKLLLGPGPSNCPPEVLNASSQQMLGHLDGDFMKIMEETKAGIQYAFQTTNDYTFAISGTGHAAMEAAICNILEPGEVFLSVVGGIWGERAIDIAKRLGAICHAINLQVGEVLTLSMLQQELLKVKPALVFVCHGDSSTGTLQPLQGIGEMCHRHGSVLLVDAVASLGGSPIFMDSLGIDILYTGAQKVLNAPPGISPISFSPRAIKKIKSRKLPVKSFYMDSLLLGNYWKCDENEIRYHHTGPINLIYALREALSLLSKETLQNSWERHAKNAEALYRGLEKIGLSFLVKEKDHRLPTVTAVKVPDGIKAQFVIAHLREKFGIDISGGLGPTAGKIWRIGLMGCNSTLENVSLCVQAIAAALHECRTQSSL